MKRRHRRLPLMALAVLLALLYVAALIAALTGHGENWIYYSHDGMPAPCPPPQKGNWPKDFP